MNHFRIFDTVHYFLLFNQQVFALDNTIYGVWIGGSYVAVPMYGKSHHECLYPIIQQGHWKKNPPRPHWYQLTQQSAGAILTPMFSSVLQCSLSYQF